MHRYLVLAALAAALVAFVYSGRLGQQDWVADDPDSQTGADMSAQETVPERTVLDISVHTLDELSVLLERAEVLASAPYKSRQNASVVLVLHGPEVEFFSTRNYDRYKEIVDRAARLDAIDIVDVKICQTMMAARGVARDDIPPFIEQVPDGGVEVERLVQEEGYVYF